MGNQGLYQLLGERVLRHRRQRCSGLQLLFWRRSLIPLKQVAVVVISQANMDGEFEGYDSSPTEIRFIRENLMPVISAIGLAPKLETRADIDRLASIMLANLSL